MVSKLPFLCILFFLFTLSKGGKDTIKRLQGSHKGTNVQGLHNLKLYLARFGYLNYQYTPNHVNPEDDEFDEELEAALKSYQTYHHLNASGTLDAPTISQMLMPRCGYPDVITHHNHTKTLHTVSHFTFFRNNPRWPPGKTQLTYAFDSSYPDVYIPPVNRAFNTWASASGYFTFFRVADITVADLKISFQRGNHGDGDSRFDTGRVLAHAFAPTDGRMHFNVDENWSVGPGPVQNAYDFETVALHEIGHLLGLDHSQYQDAVMWGDIPSGDVKGLTTDDVSGIKVLYGIPN